MSEKFICPVCGFKGLEENPYANSKEPSFEICACCGYEFGFDDSSDTSAEKSYQTYREKWIKEGANWLLPQFMPSDWQLNKQLENIIKD